MGIIEAELADFELSKGTNYTIEYNETDVIHIHIDSIRIECSVEEFLEFASAVEEGHEQLQQDKNL